MYMYIGYMNICDFLLNNVQNFDQFSLQNFREYILANIVRTISNSALLLSKNAVGCIPYFMQTTFF